MINQHKGKCQRRRYHNKIIDRIEYTPTNEILFQESPIGAEQWRISMENIERGKR